MKFHLAEYTEEEFYKLTKRLLQVRYGRTDEVCERIATIVWYEIGSKDIRNRLSIGTYHEL